MQGNEGSLRKQSRKPSKLRKKNGKNILVVFAICFLSVSCTQYNPNLYTGYDILNPGPEVTKNPIRITEDNLFVVNEAFLMWTKELTIEVEKLRKLRDPR